ncbi:phosphatase PAP2 family protein [Nocardioides sp. BP30]|uniref:phosphatase PAP2 family protein n=1 Tax=Nocardioides sp. BP30 TaxID=3036374 RepID=UPI0024694E5D|nr:phosphatase PAP2 family protein [Nocardioides sp. BP30]WGL52862.1 phosphatase PAP2 family protein [Nocardioides sp. BP30]
MYRRAQFLLIGTALLVGIGAIVLAATSGHHLVDPDGSFLGPSWARLPILLGAAIGVDLIPRTVWVSRGKPKLMPAIFRERLRTHWTRDRLTLVGLGVVCFYIVYVGYRNMKSALPFVIHTKYDHDLELIDTAILFGHHPGAVMQNVFGDGALAYLFSYVYLWFLPLVPIAVTIWIVWSRNLAYGYWFVGSQCIAWTLGTISYYALPTLGPGIAYPYIYHGEPDTPAGQLMDALVHGRQNIRWSEGVVNAVQSVAGFASLHCAITMLTALMVQHTVNNRFLRIFFWCNFCVTALATLYFGWHSLSDDVAGVMIALVSFYVGGLAAGHRFERKGTRDLEAEGAQIHAKEALARG